MQRLPRGLDPCKIVHCAKAVAEFLLLQHLALAEVNLKVVWDGSMITVEPGDPKFNLYSMYFQIINLGDSIPEKIWQQCDLSSIIVPTGFIYMPGVYSNVFICKLRFFQQSKLTMRKQYNTQDFTVLLSIKEPEVKESSQSKYCCEQWGTNTVNHINYVK